MTKIRIMLVDDHPVVRQGLSALLGLEDDFEVVAEADNGRTAVALARNVRPEVVLMDVSMPMLNGVEATRQIHEAVPSAKVLVLSSYGEPELVARLIEAGAMGYLIKESAAAELVQAIREVRGGNSFFSTGISTPHGPPATKATMDAQPGASQPELTRRQKEVLQLVAEGFVNKQIADELGVSIKTIEKHRQQLMQKVGIHDVAGLTRFAID